VLAVPDFADWCAVYILGDADVDEVEVSSGHDDPEVEAMLLGIRRTRRDVDGASESIEVGESGKSILMPDVSVAPTEEVDDSLYARLAPKSYMLVPLAARGRALGSLTLLSTRDATTARPTSPSRRRSRAAARWRSTTRACTRSPSARSRCSTPCSRPRRSGWRSSTTTCASCASTTR